MTRAQTGGRGHRSGAYSDVDFTSPGGSVFPEELTDRRQWMGATDGSKNPFAPWGDRDAPAECNDADCPADWADAPECACDARFKWGHSGHYRTGDQVDVALTTGEIAHRAFIFQEDDPFIFVDGDDVRSPDSGEVHPAFQALLAQFGVTWCEVSVSGSGVHAVFTGDLPVAAKKEPKLQLDDEVWGANDDEPVMEIYPTKHVGVLTGRHIPGTPVEVTSIDESVLPAVMEAHGETSNTKTGRDVEGSLPPLNLGKDGVNADSSTVTDDMEDVFAAIDSLDARRVAEKTIVADWIDPLGTTYQAFAPTWAPSGYDGTAVICTDAVFKDTGGRGGTGGPIIMAAIDLGIISDRGAQKGDVTGSDVHRCINHLRDLGFSIPTYVPGGDSSTLFMDIVGEYAVGEASPFESPDACLAACLNAREDGAVPVDADAPTLALHSIIDNLLGASPDSHAVDEQTYEMARAVFDELTLAEAQDRLALKIQ